MVRKEILSTNNWTDLITSKNVLKYQKDLKKPTVGKYIHGMLNLLYKNQYSVHMIKNRCEKPFQFVLSELYNQIDHTFCWV